MKLILISLIAISDIIAYINCASPNVYYANVGDTVTLRCTSGGGNYACFSTYTFQNKAFRMVYLNSSRKYQISPGSIGLTNVQATDAGFYACSNDCNQMKIDQVSYYLQPTQNGQPTDLGKQFLAIPPFDRADEYDKEALYVVVLNEEAHDRDGVFSTGEIVGLVIGCVCAFLLLVFFVLLIIFLTRRKKRQEKALEPKNKDEDSLEYSTIDRSEAGTGEKKALSDNKVDNSKSDLNTKNMTGPNIYSGEQTNVKELPNIDMNSNRSSSQRSQQQPLQSSSKQGSYNGSFQQNPSSRSYQNQLDMNPLPRPSRRESDSNGILAPPPQVPSKLPVNKINYPRNGSGSHPPQSNENIHQIMKESGFDNRILLNETPLTDDVFGRPLDNYPFHGSQEPLQNLSPSNRQNSSGGIDLESNGEGGVTVVSARTPLRSDSSQGNNLPPIMNRLPASRQQLPQQPSALRQPLSFSQRVETTSTPFQLQPSSASVRAQYNGAKLASNLKDGATDV